MALWQSRVKDAIKENRKKETAHVATELEQRRALAALQERVDALLFELETGRAKAARAAAVADAAAQTDDVEVGAPHGGGLSGVEALDLPAVPLRAQSPLPPQADAMVPDATPFTSPPAIRPEPRDDAAPPMIVTVHYGNSDGWTVDTKHRVSAGMSAGELTASVCAMINSRYALKLDCAGMCLKTHHSKAKRHVVLSEHRDMNSFAYFRRCSAEQKNIMLQLEPLPQNPLWASPTGRVSTGRASLAQPHAVPMEALA
jgi:hypothetical protein